MLYENADLKFGIAIPEGWEVQTVRKPKLNARFLTASLISPRWFTTDIEITFRLDGVASRKGSKSKVQQINNLTILTKHERGTPLAHLKETLHRADWEWAIDQTRYIHVHVRALGKQRLDYALAILSTLYQYGSPPKKFPPLLSAAPWNETPRFFVLRGKSYSKGNGDLTLAKALPNAALLLNGRILRGDTSVSLKKWQPFTWKHLLNRPPKDWYEGNRELMWNDPKEPAGIAGLRCSGIFSRHATEVLWPFMKENFVRLPCTVAGEPHFMFAPLLGTSVLDRKQSLIDRFSDGRLGMIRRYVFRETKLKDPLIFNIPEDSDTLFATAGIPEVIKRHKLTNLLVDPIYGLGREHTCP